MGYATYTEYYYAKLNAKAARMQAREDHLKALKKRQAEKVRSVESQAAAAWVTGKQPLLPPKPLR